MIAVIDYGVGNIFSLTASLAHLHIESQLTKDPATIEAADGIILPGVGAFGDAAQKLKESKLGELVIRQAQKGKPLLGICLGMQLLFEKSYEYGEHAGLGLLTGTIHALRQAIPNPKALVPHMGWNQLRKVKQDPILSPLSAHSSVYFVHSYYACECGSVLLADAEYEGLSIPAVVGKGLIYGMQFHPEKSGKEGLALLQQFAALANRL